MRHDDRSVVLGRNSTERGALMVCVGSSLSLFSRSRHQSSLTLQTAFTVTIFIYTK